MGLLRFARNDKEGVAMTMNEYTSFTSQSGCVRINHWEV